MTAGAIRSDATMTLPDGRRLTYRTYGDPAGFPVLALHGTPGSRLKFSTADSPAAALGIRLIAPDRWGYGGTSPHPAPSLRAFATDMTVLLDQLGCARASVLGVSGGGPYAAGVAACLGARIDAAALISPVGVIAADPQSVPALHMASPRLSPFHAFCFRILPRLPRATRSIFSGYGWLLRRNPELGMRVAFLLAPRIDKTMIAEPAIRERLTETFLEGLRPGGIGPATDVAMFGRPWRLPLARISARTGIWIGTEDRNVPIDAAISLATHMPGSALEVLEGEGHLWIARNYGHVLAWLIGRQKGAADTAPQTPREETG